MSKKRQKLAYVSFPYEIESKKKDEEFACMIEDIFDAGYTPMVNCLYIISGDIPDNVKAEITRRFIKASDIVIESGINGSISGSMLRELRIAKELEKEVISIFKIREEIKEDDQRA